MGDLHMNNAGFQHGSRGKVLFEERNTERLMITPAIIALAIISIFPLVYMIYISMFDFSMSVNHPNFVGLQNWSACSRAAPSGPAGGERASSPALASSSR